MEPELLDIATAGRILGVSRTTMYRLVSENRVPTVRIGRSVRIARRQLLALVDELASSGRSIESRPDRP